MWKYIIKPTLVGLMVVSLVIAPFIVIDFIWGVMAVMWTLIGILALIGCWLIGMTFVTRRCNGMD